MTASCKSCGKSISFAKTTGGRVAPFELDPQGEWEIGDDGIARHVGPPDAPSSLESAPLLEKPPSRWTSHFARCPQAKSWRKK